MPNEANATEPQQFVTGGDRPLGSFRRYDCLWPESGLPLATADD
jgi:hypothetical protein